MLLGACPAFLYVILIRNLQRRLLPYGAMKGTSCLSFIVRDMCLDLYLEPDPDAVKVRIPTPTLIKGLLMLPAKSENSMKNTEGFPYSGQ